MIRTHFLRTVIAAACAVAASGAHAGEETTLFDSYFAKVQGGTPCYARSYDDEHLKAHPQQKVKHIIFDMAKENANGGPNTSDSFELGFGVSAKTSPEWYTGVAICKEAGGAINCFLEGDGGRFSLTPDKDGALKLQTGDYGIAMEGAKDAIELSGTEGDDKVFVLSPAERSQCEASTADVKREGG